MDTIDQFNGKVINDILIGDNIVEIEFTDGTYLKCASTLLYTGPSMPLREDNVKSRIKVLSVNGDSHKYLN